MKKAVLSLMVAGSFAVVSCDDNRNVRTDDRTQTERDIDRAEENIDDAGDRIERGAERTGDRLEEGANRTGDAIDRNTTRDDHAGHNH